MRSNVTERAAIIDALPEGKRERLKELHLRGDTLNNALSVIEDAPVENAEMQEEMVALLTAERDEAYALFDYTAREFGVPDLVLEDGIIQ